MTSVQTLRSCGYECFGISGLILPPISSIYPQTRAYCRKVRRYLSIHGSVEPQGACRPSQLAGTKKRKNCLAVGLPEVMHARVALMYRLAKLSGVVVAEVRDARS